MTDQNIRLINLKRQHRMAHWKYKTLVARGKKAEIEKERRDNIGAEYRRKLRRHNKKR